MNVIQSLVPGVGGVPNYYKIYLMWLEKYESTGEDRARVLAHHYARVAVDMGQALIEDEDITTEMHA